MASSNTGLILLGLGVAGVAAYFLIKKAGSTGTKYKIGDVLYNPPDTADNFTIVGFQTTNGAQEYVFYQNQSHITFYVLVSVVDNSSAWAKLY